METFETNLNIIWLIVAAEMVFFMQVGFTAFEAGCVQAKNVISVCIKNLTDFIVSSMVFFLFGFGLMFGMSHSGWIGSGYFLLNGLAEHNGAYGYSFFFFQLVFAGTTATILTGALAERSKLSLNLCGAAFVVGVIYPVFGHWVWGGVLYGNGTGWLRQLGFIDFAGSTVVHSVGGWVAMAGAMVLGPRLGKYNSDGTVNDLGFNNIPLSTMGTFFLWFGWFGFNGGTGVITKDDIGLIVVNTVLAPTAAGLSALLVTYFRDRRPNAPKIFTALLSGLVAVTAGSNRLTPGGSVILGLVVGVIAIYAQQFIERKLKIDDPVGAIAVHGVSGAIGTIGLALLVPKSVLLVENGSRLYQFGIQCFGVVVAFAWAFGLSFAFFLILKKCIGVRAKREEEELGLNMAEYGNVTTWWDFEELVKSENLNTTLKKKIDAKTFDLQKSNKELLRANKLKSEFLANMSHELRTPLNAIIGFSEVLRDKICGELNSEQFDFVSDIHGSGNHLLQIINDILDLSKIDAGKLELKYEEFSMSDAVNEVLNIIKGVATKKRINICFGIYESVDLIFADRLKFKQILYNLLSNAVKFTPEKGDIVVVCLAWNVEIFVTVADTGIGITKENHETIFGEFFQVDGAASRQYEGTGLGLALTKQIVSLHKGRVWVDSVEGNGSKFTFTLPVSPSFVEEVVVS